MLSKVSPFQNDIALSFVLICWYPQGLLSISVGFKLLSMNINLIIPVTMDSRTRWQDRSTCSLCNLDFEDCINIPKLIGWSNKVNSKVPQSSSDLHYRFGRSPFFHIYGTICVCLNKGLLLTEVVNNGLIQQVNDTCHRSLSYKIMAKICINICCHNDSWTMWFWVPNTLLAENL